MSPKVDLTDDSTFLPKNTYIRIATREEMFKDYIDSMTYKMQTKRIGIFGDHYYYNTDSFRDTNRHSIYCSSCGRVMLPWNGKFGFCHKCFIKTYDFRHIGWKECNEIELHSPKDVLFLR